MAAETQMTRTIPVESIMFPRPTRGETMLPNRKPAAPRIAEAVPALLRAASMAMAVAVVKDIPSIKLKIKSRASKMMIEI